VDLLLGSWATKFVPGLTEAQCQEFEELLKLETLDVYNFIIEKDTPPEVSRSDISINASAFFMACPCTESLCMLQIHGSFAQHIQTNSVLKMLQDYTKTKPLGEASVEGYAKVKPMMSN